MTSFRSAYELRTLAELPLSLEEELYDTSENGKRIRELLVLSEKHHDPSYLDEAGVLMTYQAMRNPYSSHLMPPFEYRQVKHKPIPLVTVDLQQIEAFSLPPKAVLSSSAPPSYSHSYNVEPFHPIHPPQQPHTSIPHGGPNSSNGYTSNGDFQTLQYHSSRILASGHIWNSHPPQSQRAETFIGSKERAHLSKLSRICCKSRQQ
jgi:hypothetical protein